MKSTLIALTGAISVSLCSCSTQYAETPTGQKVVNHNFLAMGMQTVGPDGTISQAGSAEKAAEMLKEAIRLKLNAGLISDGINATQSVGNNAIDAIK